MFNLVQFIKKQAGDSSLDQEKEKSAALQDMSTNGIKVPKLDTTPAPSSGKSAVHDATSMPSVGRNQSAPKPQKTQKFTKIPRPLAKIAYKRNTGLADSDGLPYTNTDDVILLSKLGYTIDEDSYLFLPRGEEREGLYSYIEKNAGVPKDVSRCIDEGTAFSAEYLKDMDYSVPKGYEIKGDLCCPVEKTRKEEKESTEKTAEATHELKSSNIKAVGYNKENKSLDVAFHSGGNYTYKDVPKSLFDRIKRVKSPGKFFHKHIKRDNSYSYEKMEKESEYKWYKSKDLSQRLVAGRPYPFSYLTGEAKELLDAVKNRDWENFKEEVGDTSFGAQMLLSQATGLNHPVYADLSKAWAREKVWKDMFKEKGKEYHPNHMQGGSNYAKASKIIKAFASAGIKVDQREAERLANKYTGGKMEKEAHNMIPAPGTVTNLEAYQEPAPSKADMLGALILGDAYIPTPRNQESMLEAKQRNRRNIDMGYLDTDTARALGEKISPFIGGNPVKARLDLERMQQNPNIMSQFKQANSILDKMQNKIYKEISNAK
jgi:NTP pyrophosphatase (non-canonical NTP hydrolase)